MIRSASRIAETSGVVTTRALSAPAIAFLNPCSFLPDSPEEYNQTVLSDRRSVLSSVPETQRICLLSAQMAEDIIPDVFYP